MKKLILLTAVGVLMVVAPGCRHGGLFRRGAPVQAMGIPAAPVYCDPCATTASPCEPCSPCGACATGVSSAPMVVAPGPETYVPAPGR